VERGRGSGEEFGLGNNGEEGPWGRGGREAELADC